eukprot:799215-Prorocentrum_lima.AAC.1
MLAATDKEATDGVATGVDSENEGHKLAEEEEQTTGTAGDTATSSTGSDSMACETATAVSVHQQASDADIDPSTHHSRGDPDEAVSYTHLRAHETRRHL